MILNVSGRTDIVAFYSEWFMNRYREGFVDVRNPFYYHMVSRIYFKDVDLILFCTKNPLPILDQLKEINKKILFHVTLTPYKEDIEPKVLKKNIIEGIKRVSKIIGKDYVYVRYDPIFLNDKYTVDYHIKAFDSMCSMLDGYVHHIIVSFLDEYKNVNKNKTILKNRMIKEKEYRKIGFYFSSIAKRHRMCVQTCCEERNLVEYGFIKDDCISRDLAYKLTKKKYKKWKVRDCQCVEMVDIGVYNSCGHFCKYCYANYDEKKVCAHFKKHNKNSSLLIGDLEEEDIIKVRADNGKK